MASSVNCGPFQHYACISDRSAKNKIYEILTLSESLEIHNGSVQNCHKFCHNSSIALYNSSATIDNCFCHGHADRRNITIQIHPSDIISRDNDTNTCNGVSVYCKLLNSTLNWCSVLDETLNKAHYQNTIDDTNADILYRNYYPKCVDESKLNAESIKDTGNSNLTIGMCKARCTQKFSSNYFIPYVRERIKKKFYLLTCFRGPSAYVETPNCLKMNSYSSSCKRDVNHVKSGTKSVAVKNVNNFPLLLVATLIRGS